MASAQMPQLSGRAQRNELSRLAWAFIFSIALHTTVYTAYVGGKKIGLWEHLHLPHWLQSMKMLTELLQKKEGTKQPPPPAELPLVFVDVSPAQAVTEPPKESKFYSDKNSRAANPEPSADTTVPKIEGKQTDMVKTEDVPRSKAFPLQPAKPAEKAPEQQEEQKPKPAPKTTELAMAKPEPPQKPAPGALVLAKPAPEPVAPPAPKTDEGDAPKARPRTIKEALARQPPNQLAGMKMKQEGGVNHAAVSSSLDVTASVFGAYDAMIIAAVQNHWYSLLDERNFGYERSGRVTLSFRLHSDGTVTNVEFRENTVGAGLGLLCQSAVKDPAPYPAWPSDMRRKIGVDYRDVTFTFLYY